MESGDKSRRLAPNPRSPSTRTTRLRLSTKSSRPWVLRHFVVKLASLGRQAIVGAYWQTRTALRPHDSGFSTQPKQSHCVQLDCLSGWSQFTVVFLKILSDHVYAADFARPLDGSGISTQPDDCVNTMRPSRPLMLIGSTMVNAPSAFQSWLPLSQPQLSLASRPHRAW
jgi:hypothetical protein